MYKFLRTKTLSLGYETEGNLSPPVPVTQLRSLSSDMTIPFTTKINLRSKHRMDFRPKTDKERLDDGFQKCNFNYASTVISHFLFLIYL